MVDSTPPPIIVLICHSSLISCDKWWDFQIAVVIYMFIASYLDLLKYINPLSADNPERWHLDSEGRNWQGVGGWVGG